MSQHYDNPDTLCYNFPNFDFGGVAGDTVHSLGGPAGKKGKLREVGVATTEVFACDATNAFVKVGTSADDDAYGLLTIADLTADNTVFNSGDDTDAIIKDTTSTAIPQPTVDIPAGTNVHVTLVEGTDGTAVTGQGYPYVIIDWF